MSGNATGDVLPPWNENYPGGREEDDFFRLVFLSTYGAAVASWLLALGGVAVYCRLTAPHRSAGSYADGQVNFASFEQSMIVRLRVLGRASVFGLIGCHGWLAYLYYAADERLVAPFFGVARPFVCVLMAVFGWFADSHPLFRWVFVLGQGLQIFADTYDLWVVSASLVRNAEAGAFGEFCSDNSAELMVSYAIPRSYKCGILEQLQYRNFATIVLGIWTVLQCAYFMVSQGFFSTRYHVYDKMR